MTDDALTIMGRRLRGLREERVLSLAEVGQLIGVSRQTVSAWETGKAQPRTKHIIDLAALYNVTPASIYGGLEAVVALEADAINLRIAAAASVIPLFDSLEPAVRFILGEDIPSPHHRATHSGVSRRSAFIRLTDDACAPRFLPGDVVAIDPKVKPLPGQMVLAMVGDEFFFRRLIQATAGSYSGSTLLADNPRWPKLMMSGEDRIIGTLVEHVSTSHG